MPDYRSCRTCKHMIKVEDVPEGTIDYNTLDKWWGIFARPKYLCLVTGDILDTRAVRIFNNMNSDYDHDSVRIQPQFMPTEEARVRIKAMYQRIKAKSATTVVDMQAMYAAATSRVEQEWDYENRKRKKNNRKPFWEMVEYRMWDEDKKFTVEQLVTKDLADRATSCKVWPGCGGRCHRCHQHYCIEPRRLLYEELIGMTKVKEAELIV